MRQSLVATIMIVNGLNTNFCLRVISCCNHCPEESPSAEKGAVLRSFRLRLFGFADSVFESLLKLAPVINTRSFLSGTYRVKLVLQLLVFRGLDEHMLVVNILNDISVPICGVDVHNDRLDGRVALDKHPC